MTDKTTMVSQSSNTSEIYGANHPEDVIVRDDWPLHGPVCNCNIGARSMLQTAWTHRNPGRRFYRCTNPTGHGQCSFFEWIDPPWRGQARTVIGTLKARVDVLTKTLGERESTIQDLRKYIQSFEDRADDLAVGAHKQGSQITTLKGYCPNKTTLTVLLAFIVAYIVSTVIHGI